MRKRPEKLRRRAFIAAALGLALAGGAPVAAQILGGRLPALPERLPGGLPGGLPPHSQSIYPRLCFASVAPESAHETPLRAI